MERSAYDPQTVEARWQDRWEQEGAFRAEDGGDRPKKYVLDMFPYPSGDGLHLGHVANYTISDVIARYARGRGFNVLHPTGWDAFGLPAEQYAIDNRIQPREAVERNIEVFKGQIKKFRKLLITARPNEQQLRDIDYMLAMGELFSMIVYGHLVLEKALMEGTDEDLLNQVFDVFVRDFSGYATALHGKPGNTDRQRRLIRKLVMAPVADEAQFDKVWQEQVFALNGQYEMAD